MSKSYYEGGKRVMKGGVPVRMPAWYAELTKEGQAQIGQAKIMAPYGRQRYGGMPWKQEAPEMAMAA